MKRTALALTLVLVLFVPLVVGVEFVRVVEANPFFIFHQIDPVPGAIPPNITISSPQNNTVYSSDMITVSFNVTRPELGTCDSAIIGIDYALDGETVEAFSIWRGGSASNSWAIPEFTTTFSSPSLPTGNHKLTVTAEGVVYAGGMDIFFINSSSTTCFTVVTQPTPPATPTPSPESTPTPTLTNPSPSIEPTPNSNSEPFPTVLIATVSGMSVAVVGVGLLVYFKKKRVISR
jgi:hypothetical protein